jgi:hypothetical protein
MGECKCAFVPVCVFVCVCLSLCLCVCVCVEPWKRTGSRSLGRWDGWPGRFRCDCTGPHPPWCLGHTNTHTLVTHSCYSIRWINQSINQSTFSKGLTRGVLLCRQDHVVAAITTSQLGIVINMTLIRLLRSALVKHWHWLQTVLQIQHIPTRLLEGELIIKS